MAEHCSAQIHLYTEGDLEITDNVLFLKNTAGPNFTASDVFNLPNCLFDLSVDS
jgi:hypothetical protein